MTGETMSESENGKAHVLILMLADRFEGDFRPSRWRHWRSSIELCRHPDFSPDKVLIVHSQRTASMARLLRSDIRRIRPDLETTLIFLGIKDKHSVREGFVRSLAMLRGIAVDYEKESYFIRLAPGAAYSAIMSIVLLITSGHLQASMISLDPPIPGEPPQGIVRVFRPDIGEWLRMAARERRERLGTVSYLKSGIRTRNQAYNALLDKMERVVLRTVDPILITGPTGSGKTLLARRIYELKQKSGQIGGRLTAVNCSTLSGDMALSALFGHARGSFTGATASRAGHLRMAHDGILFLDEVGDLPLDCQARLLTALESKRFYPVGGDEEVTSQFQLLCCTNKDLAEEVAAGRFREDLLARIRLWHFHLPPLCRRREDIEPNLDYELERISGTIGRKIDFTREARARFLAFATSEQALWRGNFRELEGCLKRMAAFEESGLITSSVVDEETAALLRAWAVPAPAWTEKECPGPEKMPEERPGNLPERSAPPDAMGCGPYEAWPLALSLLGAEGLAELDLFDRGQLEVVLAVCRASASRTEAGRALFAVSRRRKSRRNDTDRLVKYLRRFGLNWEAVRA